ncbi:MAG: hypothetical protein ACPGU7_10610 [Gammaproteobacteria bacterium]
MTHHSPVAKLRRATPSSKVRVIAPPLSALLATLALCTPATASDPARNVAADGATTRDTGTWIKPDSAFSVRIADTAFELSTLRVMIGNTDYTALFRQQAPGVLDFRPGVLNLPAGINELRVIAGSAAAEEVLHSEQLRVLTASGFEDAEFEPRLSLQFKSQFDQNTAGSAPAPERPTFEDLDMTAGWSSRHTRGDWSLTSEGNIQGFSDEQNALRFAELGGDAPRIDLADYRMGLSNVAGDGEGSAVALGHISYGGNALILDNAATRGIRGRHRLSERFDISAATMNGTSIVGWDNPFGLDHQEHSITGITAGMEALPSRPGALRLELLYMEASIRNESNFDTGEVTDAEKNDGWGYTLMGESESGRLRGAYTWASSRYTNPEDPFLDQGFGSRDVITTTNEAKRLSLQYDVLAGWTADGFEAWPLNLTLDYQYDRADPLFQAVSTSAQPDQEISALRASAALGPISAVAGRTDSEDNLDNLPSILKTGTDISTAGLTLPLRTLVASVRESGEPGPFWLPDLSVNYSETHQRGLNQPIDFANGHVPDQFNTQWSYGATWNAERWGFTANYNVGDQDNRQPGRELSDFSNRTLDLSVNVRPTDTLDITLSHAMGDQRDDERNLNSFSHGWGLALNWAFADRWNFSGTYNLNETDDSQDLSAGRDFSATSQLSHDFVVPAFGESLPGQFFLTHSLTRNRSEEKAFGFSDQGHAWTLQLGISLTVF